MQGHEMHGEYFSVSKSTIQSLIDHLDKKIIAVGTTSLRTLESLYWLGVQSSMVNGEWPNEISQWEVYDYNQKPISAREALEKLLQCMDENDLNYLTAKTQIMVAPGYQFKIVKGLVTNFHQPQSTLLLLVAAFIDIDPIAIGWRKIYDYALENNFRFLSYGDGSLLWTNQM
jgi:S-adenosylmethionine:tRNA ribosyltransferase-isomerase